jgi:hypothetical protein
MWLPSRVRIPYCACQVGQACPPLFSVAPWRARRDGHICCCEGVSKRLQICGKTCGKTCAKDPQTHLRLGAARASPGRRTTSQKPVARLMAKPFAPRCCQGIVRLQDDGAEAKPVPEDDLAGATTGFVALDEESVKDYVAGVPQLAELMGGSAAQADWKVAPCAFVQDH